MFIRVRLDVVEHFRVFGIGGHVAWKLMIGVAVVVLRHIYVGKFHDAVVVGRIAPQAANIAASLERHKVQVVFLVEHTESH